VVELDLAGPGFEPTPPPDGYQVRTYVGGVPEALRAQVGVIKGMVDAEAPSGDLAWQATPVSVEAYDAEIRLWREQGMTPVEFVALDPGGTVVAWTCLVGAPDPQRPAHVEGTLVLEQHRGHRLGAAVKSASLLAARAHTRAARVRTSSDDDNVWMRATNARLGFVPVESEVVLHKQRPGGSAGRR